MFRSNPILFLFSILLIVSLACVTPSVVATPDQNVISTAIAQTIDAGLTQYSPSLVPILTDTSVPTGTPEMPSVTPTITLTSTPVFTATPLIPLISVSVATNCRIGPGRAYERVGALLVGEFAEVAGRNPSGEYWYIRNPDSGNGYCWLWGQYATVSGNFAALPIFTPPPTPTPMPDFEAEFSDLDACAGIWWVDITLDNTGGLNFRSLSLTLRDTETDQILSLYSDLFSDKDNCVDPNEDRENLPAGSTRTFSSPAFSYDPTGHKLRATITLCSNPGQSGTCVTKVITFTP